MNLHVSTFIAGLLSLLLTHTTFGQDVPEGLTAGGRIGLTTGLSVKLYSEQNTDALEAIVGVRDEALVVNLLYEFHRADFNVEGLRWYYGFGAGLTLFPQTAAIPLGLSAEGIVGLEYALPDAPLVFSLDYKPAFFLIGDPGLQAGGGLSCRYVF